MDEATEYLADAKPILACVLCQRRRVKCDRKLPCSTCVKSNVICTPRKPAPPVKHRRRPAQELRERLLRCEAMLEEIHESTRNESHETNNFDEASESRSAPSRQPAGKLCSYGGQVRFIERQVWASMYDELKEIRTLVDGQDPAIPGHPDQDLYLHLSGEPLCSDMENLAPHSTFVFTLWQMFLDRVNPLTKLIHAPSLQPCVLQAVMNPQAVPASLHALLFSIYAMTVVSMSQTECINLFGQSRDQLWRQYMSGARQSLIAADFLRKYDMTILQALLLYLLSLEDCYDYDAIWILSANSVRIAQKMGYHRDGEILGLDPFETEMRRRIWWHIVMQDAKLATAAAVAPYIVAPNADTRPPCNVNDADMHPSAAAPIQSREGPTEMAFVLLLNQVHIFRQKRDAAVGDYAFELAVLQGHARRDDNEGEIGGRVKAPHLAEMRDVAQKFDAQLAETERRHVEPSAGPVHRAALCIRPLFASKWVRILDPQNDSASGDAVDESCPHASLYKYLIASVEYRMEARDALVACDFGWFLGVTAGLDQAATMIAKTRYQPTGQLAERAWKAVQGLYEKNPELFDLGKKRYALLAQHVQEAWLVRVDAYTAKGWQVETPDFISHIQDLLPLVESLNSF